MKLVHHKSNTVPVQHVMDSVNEFKTSPSTDDKTIQIVALWLMQKHKKCLVRGEIVSKEYLDEASSWLEEQDHCVQDNPTDFNVMDEEKGETQFRSHVRSPMRTPRRQSHNEMEYGKAFSVFKDITKMCEDDKSLWQYFHDTQEEILKVVSERRFKEHTTVFDSADTVSFPNIEKNHTRQRYKSFYEKKK